MWNFLLGYFFTRSLVGDRAARTGAIIVILGASLLLLALGGPLLDLFAKSFLKGVQDGLHKWEHPHQILNSQNGPSKH
jgi:hypothetical protein